MESECESLSRLSKTPTTGISDFSTTLYTMTSNTHDPTHDVCPDYAGPDYETIRIAIATHNDVTSDDATQQLVHAWTTDHRRRVASWTEQLADDAANTSHITPLPPQDDERPQTLESDTP